MDVHASANIISYNITVQLVVHCTTYLQVSKKIYKKKCSPCREGSMHECTG